MKRERIDSPLGPVELVELVNASGATVGLTTLGAGITKVIVPDREGRMADVALGYENPLDYIGDGPACGKIPGRYANRIAGGLLPLNGREYKLPVNNGPNCNHGGDQGFHNRNWSLREASDRHAVFTYRSADGEAGFPGNLDVTATYVWTDDNELQLTVTAVTDADTVVNLTNHAYWNLKGHDTGTVLGHKLRLAASRYLPTDSTLIPSGELAPVEGTPMDFTQDKEIGRDIKHEFPALVFGKGYDACWAIDGADGSLRTAAVLSDPDSGRVLEVMTDQPGVQVYTGNWLTGSPKAKGGRDYKDYDGVAIECQAFPDSPHQPGFPSTLLRPAQEYRRHINFKFNTLSQTINVKR